MLVAGVFGFALPRFASYRSVWVSIQMMAWPQVLLVIIAAAASLASGWIVIRSALPSVRLRQAAAVNLGSTAVASTLPAGGALAMGVSWAMLSGWGVSAADYVLYTLVTGVWNVLARLGLPVIAVVITMTMRRPSAALLAGAVTGLALLVIVAVGLGLILRREPLARRADTVLRRVLSAARRLARKPPSDAGSLLAFRARAAGLLTARGWQITAATAVSNLTLFLVLLASVRGVGLTEATVPWPTTLAAFAFTRLLTVLPVTPGGAGITELGLVGILAAGTDPKVTAQVTAAVLLYRAVTFLPPIPCGAAACLAWRYSPALRRAVTAGRARRCGPALPAAPAPDAKKGRPASPSSL